MTCAWVLLFQTMYGLILEGMADYIRRQYGEEKWKQIRQKANINEETFSTHQMYNDKVCPHMFVLIPKPDFFSLFKEDFNSALYTDYFWQIVQQLSAACNEVLKVPAEKMFDMFGSYFVGFIGQYGYDTMLKVLGRHLRDFLNGLDNLHEYLKFSYPRLKAPSFRIENETDSGLILHYRSKRKGYLHYVQGQIKKVLIYTDTALHLALIVTIQISAGQHLRATQSSVFTQSKCLNVSWSKNCQEDEKLLVGMLHNENINVFLGRRSFLWTKGWYRSFVQQRDWQIHTRSDEAKLWQQGPRSV